MRCHLGETSESQPWLSGSASETLTHSASAHSVSAYSASAHSESVYSVSDHLAMGGVRLCDWNWNCRWRKEVVQGYWHHDQWHRDLMYVRDEESLLKRKVSTKKWNCCSRSLSEHRQLNILEMDWKTGTWNGDHFLASTDHNLLLVMYSSFVASTQPRPMADGIKNGSVVSNQCITCTRPKYQLCQERNQTYLVVRSMLNMVSKWLHWVV